jgi:hypothetical protein
LPSAVTTPAVEPAGSVPVSATAPGWAVGAAGEAIPLQAERIRENRNKVLRNKRVNFFMGNSLIGTAL